MDQDDERPCSRVGYVHVDAVGSDAPMRDGGLGLVPLLAAPRLLGQGAASCHGQARAQGEPGCAQSQEAAPRREWKCC
jgi:hypothetical protein